MIYYSFNPDYPHDYTGSRTPQLDPLETRKAGAPVFCHPGRFETTVKPTECGDGQVPAWADGAWSIIQDHRGETWWTTDGRAATVTMAGDPTTFEPPLTQDAPIVDPDDEPQHLEYTDFQIQILQGIANNAIAHGVEGGDYRWHKTNATEDFTLGGKRMDAQDFLRWTESLV